MIRYRELIDAMRQLRIRFKTRVVDGMSIRAYLDKRDIERLLEHFMISITD